MHDAAGQPVPIIPTGEEEEDEWRGGALSPMHGPLPVVTGAPPAAAAYLASLPRSTAGRCACALHLPVPAMAYAIFC
jgi:hypothetical protein